MRIGIDARLLSGWRGGTSVFLENIVRELQSIDDENTYYLYSNRDFALPAKNPRWNKRISWSSSPAPGTVWLQARAKRAVLADDLHIFWGPGQALPLGLPPGIGKILTVHDLVWRLYPETMASYTYAIHKLFHERWIREADSLIADSESTARGLESVLRVPSSKIQVVHLGVSPRYHVQDQKVAAQHIARKFGTSDNFILSVGTIQPRKNLSTLVEAVGILKRMGGFTYQLLIAGGSGWKTSPIYASVQKSGLSEREVTFLGHVPEEDLPLLYAGARLFVFPSLYEGFGLPLVEAMASGVPIVASDAPPVPEVVQDAAILVSPRSPQEFADAIGRVMSDSKLRADLVARGLQRVPQFQWDTAARQLLKVFEQLRRNLEGVADPDWRLARDGIA